MNAEILLTIGLLCGIAITIYLVWVYSVIMNNINLKHEYKMSLDEPNLKKYLEYEKKKYLVKIK